MTPEERIAVLEVEVRNLQASVDSMGKDVRTIRDTLLQAKGGWKTLMLVGGSAAGIGAIVAKYLPYFISKA